MGERLIKIKNYCKSKMQEIKLLDERENGVSDKIKDVRYGIMYDTYNDVLKKIETEK